MSEGLDSWGLRPDHERDVIEKFRDVRGHTFIDVGANIGTWIDALGKNFEKVIAFEPDPRAYARLVEKAPAITAKRLALSNHVGMKLLRQYRYPTSSTLLQRHFLASKSGPPESTVEVPVDTLDNCMMEEYPECRPGLIKIDTEGYEVKVIEGAMETLRKYKPACCVEIHGYENLEPVRKLLDSCYGDDDRLELYDPFKNGNCYLLRKEAMIDPK